MIEANDTLVVVVDIGGTKVAAGLVDRVGDDAPAVRSDFADLSGRIGKITGQSMLRAGDHGGRSPRHRSPRAGAAGQDRESPCD